MQARELQPVLEVDLNWWYSTPATSKVDGRCSLNHVKSDCGLAPAGWCLLHQNTTIRCSLRQRPRTWKHDYSRGSVRRSSRFVHEQHRLFVIAMWRWLALFPDQTKIQTHRHSRPSQMSVDLYTCSGYKIQRIKVGIISFRAYANCVQCPVNVFSPKRGQKCWTSRKWEQNLIKGLGWADDEMLVIISEDGSVRCHRNFREDFNQFTLGPVSQITPVRSAIQHLV